jgi:hypothetical protein
MPKIGSQTGGGRAITLAFAALVALAGASPDDKDKEAPKVVTAPDAKNHIDKSCTVEMTVRSSKNAAPRREYYLDSEEDFRDDKNFAIVISYDHAEAFQKAGIDDPSEYYKGKKLRVTGTVIHENDQTRMRVETPEKIKVMDEAK